MAAIMYTITLTLKNPMTGRTRQLFFQFDKATLDQTKWNSAFPAVQTELNGLIADSVNEEPPVWQ